MQGNALLCLLHIIMNEMFDGVCCKILMSHMILLPLSRSRDEINHTVFPSPRNN